MTGPEPDDRSMSERLAEAEDAVARARSALEAAEAGLETAERMTRKAEESKTALIWIAVFLTLGLAALIYLSQRDS